MEGVSAMFSYGRGHLRNKFKTSHQNSSDLVAMEQRLAELKSLFERHRF